MHSEDTTNEPHEGEWIYVSAPLEHLNGTARELSESIAKSICSHGWMVVGSTERTQSHHGGDARAAARTLEAVRSANACLFDVSSMAVGAEVATAVCAGRPVIALEHVDAPASGIVAALLRDGPLPRVIRYANVDACIEQLNRTLEDPVWLAAVSLAAADVH
ncbi:MAG TPA: hypothetical protein VG165_13695 [Solirubrobacteraceae bacterium]|jgi:hypothetical protein|nr:hypothetical protein [Solirubrobacteraceae bacterium]